MSEAAERELLRLGRYHVDDGLRATEASLREYGPRFDAWAVAYSGGKDSTALATVVEYLLAKGKVERPKCLYLVQIDTRVEMPPLIHASNEIGGQLRQRGWTVIRRSPKPRERLYVQMLGKGYPPANNRGNWWCTRSTKKEPQERLYATLKARHGSLLTIYGSRIDESDERAARIAQSCTAAGTECGLGLFKSADDALAPLVGWRNCAVWDWLALSKRRCGIEVSSVWHAYAQDNSQLQFSWGDLPESERERVATEMEISVDADARTGCVACHVARDDSALRRLSSTREWGHIRPYLKIIPIIDALREHQHRVMNQRTLGAGALKIESRMWALEKILAIQAEVREGAERAGKPHFDLISPDDEALIRQMIAAKTFPKTYKDEPIAMPLYVGTRLESSPGQLEMFT